MHQLIKPSEYAQIHGLSRQSVYAKIKRGTLPARKIDGRYYVVVAEKELKIDIDSSRSKKDEFKEEKADQINEYKEIIKAKDETIAVLKNSIEDLKNANKEIIKTLQEEIELLKQAFNEMRSIYLTNFQITHTKKAESPIDIEIEEDGIETKQDKKENEDECWIPLGDLIQKQNLNYNRAKQIVKKFKKAYKKGDKRIKKENGIYYISCYDFYEDILG